MNVLVVHVKLNLCRLSKEVRDHGSHLSLALFHTLHNFYLVHFKISLPDVFLCLPFLLVPSNFPSDNTLFSIACNQMSKILLFVWCCRIEIMIF